MHPRRIEIPSEEIMNRILDMLARFLFPDAFPVPALALTGADGSGQGNGGYVAPDIALELFNTGGPRSRTRKETIRATLFPTGQQNRGRLGASRVGEVWALHGGRRSLRDAAFEILNKTEFSDPNEAFAGLEGIPRVRLHCLPCPRGNRFKGAARARGNRLGFLRKALVLGKSRGGIYDPGGPVIWTEKRLGQWLELYEIQSPFYD
jgi:hypothetical protein